MGTGKEDLEMERGARVENVEEEEEGERPQAESRDGKKRNN